MKSTFTIISLVAAAAAVPDPLITPRAEVARRQNDDPALLGWLDATNGQFSESRTCDPGQTLSSSGALVQCCGGSESCIFWSSCSAGTLFASATSLFCDQGFCNTAVIVPTVGANSGANYLGCWATSLGQEPFTLIRNIGDANVAAPSTLMSDGGAQTTGSPTRTRSTAPAETETDAQGTGTQSGAGTAPSTAAAAADALVKPVSGVLGLVAVFFGML